jgi:hypothetical protein
LKIVFINFKSIILNLIVKQYFKFGKQGFLQILKPIAQIEEEILSFFSLKNERLERIAGLSSKKRNRNKKTNRF